jgi:hypothetical protein
LSKSSRRLNPRSLPRSMLVTPWIVILAVTRIVGPVSLVGQSG